MAEQPQRELPWTALQFAAFLVVVYLQVWLRVDLRLYYEVHPRFPTFYVGPDFLTPFLSYPGGPLEYVAGLLSLSYAQSWAGALVFTAVVGLICWSADVLILGLTGGRGRILAFVPGLVLLAALDQNAYQLTPYLTLLAAGLCMVVYVGLAAGGVARRALTFLVLALAVYYVAGGAFLIFASLTVVFELAAKRQRLLALVYLLSIEAIPYLIGIYFLQVSLADAYVGAMPFHKRAEFVSTGSAASLVTAGHLAFVLVALAAALSGRLAARPVAGEGRGPDPRPAKRRRTARAPREARPPIGATLGLVAATALVSLLTLNQHVHTIMEIDDLARRGMWEEILRKAPSVPPDRYTSLVSQHVNRALYETGRLPYDMFSFRQWPGSLMVDMALSAEPKAQSQEMGVRCQLWSQIGDIDLRLGLVNETEHEAHEALSIHGPHPEILYRLAYCNILKRQPDAARVFLRAMACHPLEGPRARALLARLAADPALSSDPDIQHLRDWMPVRDLPAAPTELAARCSGLLEANPRNRMAFEYLMACHLVSGQLDQFAQELHRLADFDYPDIPRAYEEAILLWEMKDTSHQADRCGRQIASGTLDRFARFWSAFNALAASAGREAARAQLADEYGNTYLYYHVFGQSGVGKR